MTLFDDAEEEKLDSLLTEHYNYLVRHINTREFIPHLISKQVLTRDDKEDIESKITSVDRAGRLIDLVKMNGYKGMYELMLVLEYDVPAAFFHVKQQEARSPPADWLQLRKTNSSVRKRRSRESMSHLTNLIGHLMAELSEQKRAVDEIMHKMSAVQNLQTETSQEQEDDWKHYETQIVELESKYAVISKELVQSKKEHDETKAKYEEAKQENDRLYDQRNKDLARLTSLQADHDALWEEVESLKSRKSRPDARDSKDVEKLVQEIDRLTELLQSPAQKQNEDQVARLRSQVEKMAQRNAEFSADICKAQEERDRTSCQLKKTEADLEEQKRLVLRLKEENATCKKKNEDLELQLGRLEDEMYWQMRKKIRDKKIQSPPTTPVSPEAQENLAANFSSFGFKSKAIRGRKS